MAEEVKIVDVAGGPAAEATLQELLKVMKGGAGGGGGGGSSDAASKASELSCKLAHFIGFFCRKLYLYFCSKSKTLLS